MTRQDDLEMGPVLACVVHETAQAVARDRWTAATYCRQCTKRLFGPRVQLLTVAEIEDAEEAVEEWRKAWR